MKYRTETHRGRCEDEWGTEKRKEDRKAIVGFYCRWDWEWWVTLNFEWTANIEAAEKMVKAWRIELQKKAKIQVA
jgi:hypothetical protein